SSRSRSWSRIEWNFVTAPLRHRTHTKSRPLVYFMLLPEGGGCSAGAFVSPARSGAGASSDLAQGLARVPPSFKGWRKNRVVDGCLSALGLDRRVLDARRLPAAGGGGPTSARPSPHARGARMTHQSLA